MYATAKTASLEKCEILLSCIYTAKGKKKKEEKYTEKKTQNPEASDRYG